MGKPLRIAVAILLIGLGASAFSPSTAATRVEKLFEQALQSTGGEYFTLREQIVSQGKDALPYLRQKSQDHDWHVAQIALALSGRIERPNLYRSLDDDVVMSIYHAERMRPGIGKMLPGFALHPGGSHYALPGRQPSEREKKALELWSGTDATAFMIEAMLKGFGMSSDVAADIQKLPDQKVFQAWLERKTRSQWPDYGRVFCIIRLGVSVQPVALTALLEALQSLEREDVAAPAAWAFGAIDREKAEQPLVVLLKRMTRPQRDYVVLALANIKSVHAAPYLPEVAANPYVPVWFEGPTDREVCKELVDIGGSEGVRELLKTLTPPRGPLATDAMSLLAEMKVAAAIDPLLRLLTDDNESVRRIAADALGAFPEERVVDALIGALKDPSERVRYCAAGSLGRLGSKRAVSALIGAAADENEHVRANAISALARVGDPSTTDVILAALKDSSPTVRLHAIGAQKTVKDPRAVELLIDRLMSGEPEHRWLVEETVREITGASFKTSDEWREWWNLNKDRFQDRKPFRSGDLP